MLMLGEALSKEMARVRDKLMPAYRAIGPAGAFRRHMMRADLNRAAKAVAEDDLAAMMRAYDALKRYKL